jgi:flavin-dependent dehydrogenase
MAAMSEKSSVKSKPPSREREHVQEPARRDRGRGALRRVADAEHEANRADVEGNFLTMLELAPAFADRVRGATREARFVGVAVANFFRQPYGPGWALVGDAGYTKDFITAQGMHDAFRDAEGCATAVHDSFSGARSFDTAMAAYQSTRAGPE